MNLLHVLSLNCCLHLPCVISMLCGIVVENLLHFQCPASPVVVGFREAGSDLYRKMVHAAKKCRDKGTKPSFIGDEEWAHWVEYWREPLVVDQAAKKRENRLTEPTDGTGTSRHHYGSRAVVTDHQMTVSVLITY